MAGTSAVYEAGRVRVGVDVGVSKL